MKHTQSTRPGLSDSDILDAINAIPSHPINTDPKWRTVMQWAAAWGLPKNTALNKCRVGAENGLFEVEQRYAGVGCYVRKQSHYRWAGKKRK